LCFSAARRKETDAFVSVAIDGVKKSTTIRFNTTAPSWNESMALCASVLWRDAASQSHAQCGVVQ
jgi:hypothetical protein